ncbi:MAG: hypothetical protein Q9227_002563 [Pyrenula ochraceoflavens]
MLYTLSPLTVGVGLIFLAFALYKFIVYPAFISPLSQIPNAHPTAPFSEAWILWKRYQRQNNRTIHAAHVKHGRIVRLAPNELSVNCVDGGIRTIYAGGFEKGDCYINMFSQPFNKPHSARRRLMSNVYSKSFIQTSAQLGSNSKTLLKERFLPYVNKAAEDNVNVNVHEMNNAFTMDFMSAYLFGMACSTNFTADAGFRRHWLFQYQRRKPFEFHKQELPNFTRLCNFLHVPFVPRYVDEANNEIEDWGIRMCDSANAYFGELEAIETEPVLYKQLKTALQNQLEHSSKDVEANQPQLDKDQQRLSVASDMLDHLSAGHETSAICLTYVYWEMSKRPELQRRLREELMTLSPQMNWTAKDLETFELPHPKAIDSLPLLHAILMETLRLHAPIPGPQPRITPPKPTELAGYSGIPAGVRVSAQAYTLHRNPEVFPEPEEWKYDRWLKDADSLELKEMLRWFWAFGSGGRMCIGSNLAMQEMKLWLAALYSNYETELVDDEGIEAIDAYTTKPKSNKLILKFRHISERNG